MMRNIIILLALSLSSAAQIYKPISFPEKVDKKYVFEPLKEQEKYLKKIRKSIPKKYAESFSVMQTFGKSEKFTSGEVYLSWEAMESYVNGILDSIMPSSLTAKKIRAYIGRNSAINAYCLYDGTMIVNVGLLAEVKSEAALAAVMGHELSHFMKNHHLNRMKKLTKKSKKAGLKEDLNYMGFSQDNELEADEKGFEIAKSANYDLEEAHSNFELFIREEEYFNKRHKSSLANTDSVEISTKAGKFRANTLEKLLSSHPAVKDRKDKLTSYIKTNTQTKKQKFKFSESTFKSLQSQAKQECVYLIFNNNDYQECLERAFTYYLYQPGDLTLMYYIAECTRRLCLLDYKLRKKGFLTEALVNDGFKPGEGILHDLHYLVPNNDLYKKIAATELTTKTPAFETYKDAFAYFTKKLIDKNHQEAYLMRALFENNKGKIRENTDKYLASAKAEHKEYAKNYLDNKLTDVVAANTKEIVMIPRVNFFRHPVFNRKYSLNASHFYYKRSEITGSQMANELSGSFNAGLSEVKSISLPLAATENFNTKYNYENIIKTTILARRDENEGYEVVHYYKELEDEDYIGKTDIFRLSPQTWEFFKSNGINAITLANYSRHVNTAGRKLRVVYLFFGPIGWLCAAGTVVQYKKLSMLSYDARLGALYYDYNIKAYRLSSRNAKKMFKKLREDKAEFIKDYNSRFN
jgi:Zn-dependent protease with chaperone function